MEEAAQMRDDSVKDDEASGGVRASSSSRSSVEFKRRSSRREMWKKKRTSNKRYITASITTFVDNLVKKVYKSCFTVYLCCKKTSFFRQMQD